MLQFVLSGKLRSAVSTARPDMGLYAVAVIYVLLFGALMTWSGGLPYVLDNNESFSSIVHAQNMLRFGVLDTFGLTDEAYGPHAAAHPYVYTHQGNFPRIYALLIYVFGAQSIEAQTVVTTLTIGLASIIFAYLVISVMAGRTIAVIVCVLMMTDYVFVAQWQVVTWRVWHLFFFWFGFWSVDRVARSERPAAWLALIVAAHISLFYFEIAFAAFSASVTALYAAWKLHKQPLLAATLIGAQAVGLAFGVLILMGQLVAYLGWDGAMADLRLTAQARNMGGNEEFQRQVREFMERNHIVFWYNFNQADGLRQLGFVWSQYVSRTLSIYSPILIVTSLAGFVGVVVARLAEVKPVQARFGAVPVANDIGTAVIGAAFLAPVFVVSTGVVPGLDIPFIAVPIVLAVAVFLACLTVSDLRVAYGRGPVGLPVVVAPVVVAVVTMVIVFAAQDALGWPGRVWLERITALSPVFSALMIVFALWSGIQLSVWATSPRYAAFAGHLARLAVVPLVGLVAFLVVWMLTPGYVLTGYLHRFAPFVAFSNLVFLGIGCIAVLGVAVVELRNFATYPWVRAVRRSIGRPDVRRVRPLLLVGSFDTARVVVCAMLAVLVPLQWIGVNAGYLERIPPNQAEFLKLLNEPPFAGATFVVDNYAAPVAVQTDEWAYYDPAIAYRRVVTVDGRTDVQRDMRYLWFADRAENADYLRPDFYLCFSSPNLEAGMRQQGLYRGDCSARPMTATAGNTIDGVLETRLERKDESGRDRWSIVRLKWHGEPGDGRAKGREEEIDVERY